MIVLIRSGDDQFVIKDVIRIDHKSKPNRTVSCVIEPFAMDEHGRVSSTGEIELTTTRVEILPN